MSDFISVPAVIKAQETLSDTVDCTFGSSDGTVECLIMPDNWAGKVYFLVSFDGTEWHEYFHYDGSDLFVTANPGGAINVGVNFSSSIKLLRLRTEAHTDDRLFKIIIKGSPGLQNKPAERRKK